MSREKWVYLLSFIGLYMAMYMTTGTILFIYESTWFESRGTLWDVAFMNGWQAIAYVVWFIPNYPLGGLVRDGFSHLVLVMLVNPILIGGVLLRIFSLYRPHWIFRVSKINFGMVGMAVLGWIWWLVTT